jgi:hypothetical protein
LIVEKAEILKESGNQVSILTSNLNGICPAVPGRRAAGDGGLSIAGCPVLFLELCRPQTWQVGRIKNFNGKWAFGPGNAGFPMATGGGTPP